jgi:hypothetical protein
MLWRNWGGILMADIQINSATQQTPAPLKLGTTSTTALAGNTPIPSTFLMRINGSTVAMYMEVGWVIPVNTWLAFNLQYRSDNSAGNTTMTMATGFAQDSGAPIRGGGGNVGDNCFLAGYFQNTAVITSTGWLNVGTVSGRTANTSYYGVGVKY